MPNIQLYILCFFNLWANIILSQFEGLMTNPFIITKCGHTFQKNSLEEWVKKKSNCPICRISITKDDYKPNFMMKSLIEDLMKEYKLKE